MILVDYGLGDLIHLDVAVGWTILRCRQNRVKGVKTEIEPVEVLNIDPLDLKTRCIGV